MEKGGGETTIKGVRGIEENGSKRKRRGRKRPELKKKLKTLKK